MRRRARHLWMGRVAAFLAVALLSLAAAPSAVMQVAAVADPAALWPICATEGGKNQTDKGHAAGSVCAFCAAAAHAPLMTMEPPLRVQAAWSWIAVSPCPASNLAAAPAVQPKARGPPRLLRTV